MKVITLRSFKNILFIILKILILIISFFIIYNTTVLSITGIMKNYDFYKLGRSLENYGVETIAYLNQDISSKEKGIYIYEYQVENENFSLEIDINSIESIDESVKILYDSISPMNSMCLENMGILNLFYSNSFKTISILYLKYLGFVVILGCCWFGLDYLKYNKLLWKEYV